MSLAQLHWDDRMGRRPAPAPLLLAVEPCAECEGSGERENRFGRMDACDDCDGTGRANAVMAVSP